MPFFNPSQTIERWKEYVDALYEDAKESSKFDLANRNNI